MRCSCHGVLCVQKTLSSKTSTEKMPMAPPGRVHHKVRKDTGGDKVFPRSCKVCASELSKAQAMCVRTSICQAMAIPCTCVCDQSAFLWQCTIANSSIVHKQMPALFSFTCTLTTARAILNTSLFGAWAHSWWGRLPFFEWIVHPALFLAYMCISSSILDRLCLSVSISFLPGLLHMQGQDRGRHEAYQLQSLRAIFVVYWKRNIGRAEEGISAGASPE